MNLPISNKKRNKPKIKSKPIKVLIHEEIYRDKLKSRTIKYLDNYISGNVTSTPGLYSLCNIPQGATQSERVADTIWMTKIESRIIFLQDNIDVSNTVRFFYFIWKINDNSAAPSSITLFDYNIGSWNTLTPLNFDYRKNYRVVGKDHFSMLIGGTSSYTEITGRTFQPNYVLNNQRVDYTEGLMSGTNKLYFAWLSSSSVTPYPLIAAQFRLWYYDE